MIRTALNDLLDIRFPILQGGMAWVSDARLAAAVSAAGGLGIIGSGNAPASWVREQVQAVRAMTSRPFGVNVMLMSPHAAAIMEVVAEERVPVVTTGAGNPGKYLSALKEAGTKVIPVVSAVSLAKRLAKAGVDAIIAEGTESGGHIGEETTLVLVPQVVDAVEVPVIAAGGIADGRALAAALALGAAGVQVGTRFMCAEECTVHPEIKQMILKARDRDTVVTGRPTGHPVRILRNKLSRMFQELEAAGASPEELEQLGQGSLKAAMADGDVQNGSVMAGQAAALVYALLPAAEILAQMERQAEEVLQKMKATVVHG